MSDSTAPEGAAIDTPDAADAGQGNTDQTTHNDDHLKKLIAERDKAKSRARELEAQMSEIEKAKAEAEEAKAKAEGRWEDLVSSRDATIAEYRSQLEAEQQRLAKLQAGMVERDILDGISREAQADPALVRAAYRDLAASAEWDPSPKDLEKAAAKRLEEMRSRYPSLFEASPKPSGGAPPRTPNRRPGPMSLG